MSTRNTWRLTVALLMASVAVAGCSSAKKGDPKAPEKKPEPAAAKDGSGKDAPAKAPAKETAKADPAPKAAPAAKAAGDVTLDEVARDRQRREEKRKFLLDKYLEMGDALYASGEFEKARVKYSEALELESGNAHARKRLDEIGAHLNERGGSAADTFETAREIMSVKMEQARMEVAAHVRTAQAATGKGDFQSAVDSYEKALVIVELFPYQVDFNPDGDALRRLIADAKERQRTADQARRAREFEQARRVKEAEAAAEKRQRRETILTLFRDANAAMESEQYSRARGLAEEILRIDANNEDADRLRTYAVRAHNAAREDSIRRDTREEWKNVFERLQRDAIPQSETIEFPETWDIAEGRDGTPKLTTLKEFESDPREAAILARLESVRTPLNIGVDESTITALLKHLSDLTGVNIVMDGPALEGKSEEDLMLPPLQLATPMPVREILSLVTGQKGLSWKVSHGAVMVTTHEEVRGKAILDLYDVKDITTGIKDFAADDINLMPSGSGSFALPFDEDTEPKMAFEGDQIKELISQNIDPEVWSDGSSTVEFREPGTLVVKAPATTHAKVRKLLSDMRATGGMQVAIETRFITVQDNFLQDIGVDLRGLGDDSLGSGTPGKGTGATFDDVLVGSAAAPGGIGTSADPGVFYNFIHGSQDLRARVENLYDVALGKPGILTATGGTSLQATYLDDAQVEAILRAVQKSERSTQVIAPRITAYNNQRANVQVLNQVSYIQDFDVEIAQLAQIGDPIIQQLRDGIILDIHPVISADRRFVTLELRPTVAILQRPIATFQTTLGNGPPVAIQLPEIRIQRVRTTVTVPDGGSLLLGGLRFFEESRLDSTVPWLDKVPVLSFFWRRQGTYIERRNLIILLRCNIIRLEEHEPRMGRRG